MTDVETDPLLDKLDEAEGLLNDIRRTKSAAVRHHLDRKPRMTRAQLDLMASYAATLGLRVAEASHLLRGEVAGG